jgi:hypothetical protein
MLIHILGNLRLNVGMFIRKVRKYRGKYIVTIPAPILKKINYEPGDLVSYTIKKDPNETRGQLIIQGAVKPRFSP